MSVYIRMQINNLKLLRRHMRLMNVRLEILRPEQVGMFRAPFRCQCKNCQRVISEGEYLIQATALQEDGERRRFLVYHKRIFPCCRAYAPTPALFKELRVVNKVIQELFKQMIYEDSVECLLLTPIETAFPNSRKFLN